MLKCLALNKLRQLVKSFGFKRKLPKMLFFTKMLIGAWKPISKITNLKGETVHNCLVGPLKKIVGNRKKTGVT